MLGDKGEYLSFNGVINSEYSIAPAIGGESAGSTSWVEVEDIIQYSVSGNVGVPVENGVYLVAIKT